MIAAASGQQCFMFLQGPASPFFATLGKALLQAGNRVIRVNLCGGDSLCWPALRGAKTLNFPGLETEWPDFLRLQIQRYTVTDIVAFGCRRPIHSASAELADATGITYWSFEEGYLRPNWITLERSGNNGASPLPRDPQQILSRASELANPPAPKPVSKGSFRIMAVRQIAYEAASIVLWRRFIHYRSHRPVTRAKEAWGWVRRITRQPSTRASQRQIMERIRAGEVKPYFLFPLQLDADYQMRFYSKYGSMTKAIFDVIQSFANHAPENTNLLIKLHPHDIGLPDLLYWVSITANTFGVSDRVFAFNGGYLPTLIRESKGVVTVNSTVGLSALLHRRAVKALGKAIYDIPGLTFQGNLNEFWCQGKAPSVELMSAFHRVVIHDSQINGNFYTKAGIKLAVEGALARLTAQNSNLLQKERLPSARSSLRAAISEKVRVISTVYPGGA